MADEAEQTASQQPNRKTDEQIVEEVRKDPVRRALIRAYDFVIDNFHSGFISSATSGKRKFGNGLSVYAIVTGLIGGGTGLFGHFKADDFNDVMLARAVQDAVTKIDTPAPQPGQCYYIDPTQTRKVVFFEYTDNIATDAFKAVTQWNFTPQTVAHDLGEIPSLRSANCDALKDDQKISGLDAEKKAVEIRYVFMQQVQDLDAYKTLKSKGAKGVFTFTP